jgi:hypothetical protein
LEFCHITFILLVLLFLFIFHPTVPILSLICSPFWNVGYQRMFLLMLCLLSYNYVEITIMSSYL